jgi:hypothetical protein
MWRLLVAVVVALSVVAAHAPPIEQGGDPCNDHCTFTLCAKPGPPPTLEPCGGCGDVRVTIATGAKPVRVRFRKTTVRLSCSALGAPCLPCHSDADCDDRDPATVDVCFGGLGCGHAGPGR